MNEIGSNSSNSKKTPTRLTTTEDEMMKMQMNQRCSINSHLAVEETSGVIVNMPSAATTKKL
jgi:hypothetical protein